MAVDENLTIVQPVTKKLFDMGSSGAALWRKAKRAGIHYSYAYFMGVLHGRERNQIIEDFAIAEGFGPELAEAQENHQKELAAKEAAAAKAKEAAGQ